MTTDAVCPWASDSPDVFYTYVAAPDVTGIRVFLCDSQYDTKTYVLDEAFNEIACDDDFCDSKGGGIFSFAHSMRRRRARFDLLHRD